MRRFWNLSLVTMVALMISGCSPDTGPFRAEDLHDAKVLEEIHPPSDWTVFPGNSAPSFGRILERSEEAVAMEIHVSDDQGETWKSLSGSPVNLTGRNYFVPSVSRTEQLDKDAAQFHFRARWVLPGPKVSPWSPEKVVLGASTVSQECRNSLSIAADVPLAEDNNEEVSDSLHACKSMEEWITALYLAPGAMGFGFDTLNQIEPSREANIVCSLEPRDPPACENSNLGVYKK